MTDSTRPVSRLCIPAAAAALMLAGCSATHVGDSWQCPLAQGEVCASVAAADPAVADAAVPASLSTATPLHRPRSGSGTAGMNAGSKNREDCRTGCNPFAWLARLFAADAGDDGDGEAIDVPRGRKRASSPNSEAVPDASSDPANDGLRTPEVIGRVWIAPFVDADGVYREAGWVRTVIEPARWRLP